MFVVNVSIDLYLAYFSQHDILGGLEILTGNVWLAQ